LHIYFCPDAAWCKTKLPKKFIAQFPANKNIYVKWNGKKLEPQQGSIFGKTTKGYRTKNNVVQKDIRTSVTESPKMPPSKQQPAPKSKVEESWDQFPEAKKLFDQGKKVEAYRKVLGVSSSATASQISSAYKKLSLKWHPDKCVLKDKDICTEVQKILNEARDTLAK